MQPYYLAPKDESNCFDFSMLSKMTELSDAHNMTAYKMTNNARPKKHDSSPSIVTHTTIVTYALPY